MDVIAILKTLESLAIADYVRSAPWAYPILETIHMFGLGLVFGGIFLFDLRLLGVGRALPLKSLADHILPWVWFGFLLNLVSGMLLFLSDAVTFGLNLAFQAKLVLLVVTGVFVFWFQRAVYPKLSARDQSASGPPAMKVLAIVSISLWLAIITAGRMIAYVPESEIEEADPTAYPASGTRQSAPATANTGHAKWRPPAAAKI